MKTGRNRIDAYLPLRPVEFHILLSLAAGERHGYGIIHDIETRDDANRRGAHECIADVDAAVGIDVAASTTFKPTAFETSPRGFITVTSLLAAILSVVVGMEITNCVAEARRR